MSATVTPAPENAARTDPGRGAAYLAPEINRLRRWTPRGALALLDQGLISGSNFVLGVTLARSAGPEPYGAYMIMFAAFLLVANVHQALLLEPTNVLAFSLFPQRSDRYLRKILAMHVIFSLVFVALAGSAWIAAPQLHIRGALASALVGLIVATPCILLFWLARCFAYLDFAPGRAARGSAIYCAAVFAGMWASYLRGGITPLRAFLCTAAAAVVASLVLLRSYGTRRPAMEIEPGLSEIWTRHWRFGRWGLSTVGLSWAQTNSISVISGPLLGLRATGGLNALVGLLLPMFQVLSSVTRVVLPRISQIYTEYGIEKTQRPVLRVGATLGLLTGGYWLALTLLHTPLLHSIYGERFAPYAGYVPVISIHLVACAMITTCDIAFNSIQSPQSSFRIKLFMVAIMLPVNTFLTWRFGLIGAVLGVPALSAGTGICMAAKLRQVWRRPEGVAPEVAGSHA